MDNLKTVLRLYRRYAVMDLLWLLRDTRYFIIQILSDGISAGCTVAGVYLLSLNFDHFAGMGRNEILFMMGYALFVEGIFNFFFIGNNAGFISRVVGRGQLDHIMIQPVPLWAELLTQGFCPFSGSPLLLMGAGLALYGAFKVGIVMHGTWLLLCMFYGICSCLLIMAFLYIISSMAFYAPAAAEEISMVGKDMFSSLKTYPLGNMNPVVKRVFITILPIGLSAWFPSLRLLEAGVNSMASLKLLPALYLPAATAVFSLLALFLFRKGMKHYERYGSPRYSGFGFR